MIRERAGACLPLFREVEHERAATPRAFASARGDVPTGIAPFVPSNIVETPSSEMTRIWAGRASALSRGVGVAQDMNRKRRAAAEEAGEHAQDGVFVADEASVVSLDFSRSKAWPAPAHRRATRKGKNGPGQRRKGR